MNYDNMDMIARILNNEGLGVHQVGWYFHYLLYFSIRAALQKRSLSTDELKCLPRHLKCDANRWGISEEAVIDLTREKLKFVTENLIKEILKYERGNLDNTSKKDYIRVEYPNYIPPTYYHKDPYNDKTIYGPYSDIT